MNPNDSRYQFRDGKVVAFNVTVDGQHCDEIEVGTVVDTPVLLTIGGGRAVHEGTSQVATFTVTHVWHRGPRTHTYRAGTSEPFEPYPNCSSHSTYRGGMRGRNRLVTGGEATCQKCRKN